MEDSSGCCAAVAGIACNFVCMVPTSAYSSCTDSGAGYWIIMVGNMTWPLTFTSLRMLRLKQQNRILRWPGLRPSTMDGMERSRSARENRINSCKDRSNPFSTGSNGLCTALTCSQGSCTEIISQLPYHC